MRDAKMEAMGLRPEDHDPPKHKHSRMATDDVVSEMIAGVMSCYSPEMLGHGTFQEAYAKVRPHHEPAALWKPSGSRNLTYVPVVVYLHVSNLCTYTLPESITLAESSHVRSLARTHNHPLSNSTGTKFPTNVRYQRRTSL